LYSYKNLKNILRSMYKRLMYNEQYL